MFASGALGRGGRWTRVEVRTQVAATLHIGKRACGLCWRSQHKKGAHELPRLNPNPQNAPPEVW